MQVLAHEEQDATAKRRPHEVRHDERQHQRMGEVLLGLSDAIQRLTAQAKLLKINER